MTPQDSALVAELARGALRAEHRQVVVDVEMGAPLVGGVLVVARLPAALGAHGRAFGGGVRLLPWGWAASGLVWWGGGGRESASPARPAGGALPALPLRSSVYAVSAIGTSSELFVEPSGLMTRMKSPSSGRPGSAYFGIFH